MKIQINYELFEKIKEAETGFSLKRFSSSVVKSSSIVTLVSTPLYLSVDHPEKAILGCFLFSLMFQTTGQGLFFRFLLPH